MNRRFSRLILFATTLILVPAFGFAEKPNDKQIEDAREKLLNFLSDRQGGETLGSVYVLSAKGTRTLKGSFRIARASNQRFRFDYLGSENWCVTVVGKGDYCDVLKTYSGSIIRNQDVSTTLGSIAGITKRSSTIVVSTFHGRPDPRLREGIANSDLKIRTDFGGSQCGEIEIDRPTGKLIYEFNIETGIVFAIEKKTRNNQDVVRYELRNSFSKKISDEEFEIPDEAKDEGCDGVKLRLEGLLNEPTEKTMGEIKGDESGQRGQES